MVSSRVLFAAAIEDADLVKASPIPPELIANLLPTSLNLSTIEIASLACIPNACIVEITLELASSMPEISSPTTL